MTKLGVQLPLRPLVPNDPKPMADFLKGIEDLGYSFIQTNDHVLGAELATRPNWFPQGAGRKPTHDHTSVVREALVLFGYLAGLSQRFELVNSILISPQRQTALIAKQAAEIDLLSGGRLRMIIAAGWNDVDFEGLGVDFEKRGTILEEQIPVLKALWTQEVVTFKGKYHNIDHAGIHPLPIQRPIPLWVGGNAPAVLRKVGQLADGWAPALPFDEERLKRDMATIWEYAKAKGRDASKIGLQPNVAAKSLEEVTELARKWKGVGATHMCLHTLWAGQDGPSQLKALGDVRKELGQGF